MELFFNYATPVVYWLLIIIWGYILIFYLRKVQGVSSYNGLLKLALIILAIDAFRTVFESFYFGAWYTSLSGLIPIGVFNYLAQPEIVFIPKIINLTAAILILTILIKRWLNSEISQEKRLNDLIELQTKKIQEISANQKKGKEKAEESNELYSGIFNNSTIGLYQTTPSGKILSANPAIVKMLKFNSQEDLSQRDLSKWGYVTDSNRIEFKNLLQEKGEITDFESEWYTAEGEILTVLEGARAIKDNNGEIIRYDGTVQDITDKKKIQAALLGAKEKAEESEMNFRKSIENAPYPLMIHAEGEVTHLSKVWTEITGYTIADIPTIAKWTEIAYGKDAIPSQEFINKLYTIKTKQNDGEWVVCIKSGEKRIWDFSTSPIGRLSDGRMAVITMAVDITEQKQINKKLKDSELKFREMANFLPQIVYETDLLGNLQFVNKYAFELFGYSQQEFDNRFDIFRIIAEEDHERAKASFKWILSGNDSQNNEYTAIRKDGSTFPALAYSTAILKENKPVGIRGILVDNSRHKQQEKALLIAKDKAMESDRLKSAFLANMSHEIRTPMNGILGFADLLKTPGLNTDKQEEYVGIIEKSGQRMLNIINDIIDISKIESGQMTLDITESNINKQIEYIYTFFNPEAEKKGLQLFCKTPLSDEESIVKTDREKVYAILTNLVKNAIKYTNNGTIEFGYAKREKLLGTTTADKEYCVLEFYVKDTGIGIPQERQRAIFERFIQADIEDKKTRQGAGLGLAITQAYVEMLGGDIWVKSEPRQGSTFYFTIKYERADEIQRPVTPTTQLKISIPNSKTQILVAEDDEVSFLLIKTYLKKINMEIIHAKNGKEAIAKLNENPLISIILMDLNMPVMDGLSATKHIRQFDKAIPIIAQTAFALSGDKDSALNAGCTDYLSKPIKSQQLYTIIEKHLIKV